VSTSKRKNLRSDLVSHLVRQQKHQDNLRSFGEGREGDSDQDQHSEEGSS
jgi:hypothetical protein